jgi:hypothetical protein
MPVKHTRWRLLVTPGALSVRRQDHAYPNWEIGPESQDVFNHWHRACIREDHGTYVMHSFGEPRQASHLSNVPSAEFNVLDSGKLFRYLNDVYYDTFKHDGWQDRKDLNDSDDMFFGEAMFPSEFIRPEPDAPVTCCIVDSARIESFKNPRHRLFGKCNISREMAGEVEHMYTLLGFNVRFVYSNSIIAVGLPLSSGADCRSIQHMRLIGEHQRALYPLIVLFE